VGRWTCRRLSGSNPASLSKCSSEGSSRQAWWSWNVLVRHSGICMSCFQARQTRLLCLRACLRPSSLGFHSASAVLCAFKCDWLRSKYLLNASRLSGFHLCLHHSRMIPKVEALISYSNLYLLVWQRVVVSELFSAWTTFLISATCSQVMRLSF